MRKLRDLFRRGVTLTRIAMTGGLLLALAACHNNPYPAGAERDNTDRKSVV